MKKFYFQLMFCILFISKNFAQTIISKTIYFDSNAYQIKQPDLNWLDSVSVKAVFSEKYSVSINAYCDITHTDSFNLELSQLRANTVYDRLIKNKIDPKYITAKGNGELGQLNDNSTTELRQLNRRAEIAFTITEKKTQPIVVEKVLPKKIEEPKQTLQTELQNLEANKKIILEGLNFYGGSVKALPSAKEPLQHLLNAMNNNPNLEILIVGHVCCLGDYNISLGRAETVMTYLKDHGISIKRMTCKGVSNTEPLVEELTPEDQAKNRRVEIVVKKL